MEEVAKEDQGKNSVISQTSLQQPHVKMDTTTTKEKGSITKIFNFTSRYEHISN